MTPRRFSTTALHFGLAASALVILSACSSKSLQRAPVEDRSRSAASNASPRVIPATRPALGRENLGKPGYYEVQAGDNLFRISRNFGRSVPEIARWNGLSDPYIIEIGDVLRVSSSGSSSGGGAPVVNNTPVTPPSPDPEKTRLPDPSITWAWPASGPILQGFDPAKNKGVDLAGKAGDPVLAAADGSVVYAGSALRGYGNLVIVKHGATFVSAYAHNQSLLVKDGQSVKRGQKIAEMGQSEADRVKLHFEIRKNSTPIDPMQYLPSR
jgi:lipoprotein NlpD